MPIAAHLDDLLGKVGQPKRDVGRERSPRPPAGEVGSAA